MTGKGLTLAVCVLFGAGMASGQATAKRQLIVPLNEGGFVAFKSETSWTDAKKASTDLQRGSAELGSQAVMDGKHIIHRILEDNAEGFIFGYDLLVVANPKAKQFKIEVRPLDRQFESKLRAEKTAGGASIRAEMAATFPTTATTQMLDDGDAFSLDLLVNQSTGIKIVDVVSVTFDPTNLRAPGPRMMPRDFTLDAVELAMKDYRLLIDGNAIAAGKSANGFAGALLWFYVQDQGRFIFSLVPRAGYGFQKVGIIDDNRIEFTLSGNRYEWLSSSPILPGGGTWNLWVLHDPSYSPIFGSAPSLSQKKSVWQKVDDAVNLNQTSGGSIRNKTTLQVSTPTQTSQSNSVIKRPRVMVGGADRIENLWPKEP